MRLQEGDSMSNRINERSTAPVAVCPARARLALAVPFVAGLLAVTLVVGGCASGRSYPPAPELLEAASGDVEGYKIGPLDTLSIYVWRNPDLSSTVTVRPDGKIATPLAGETVAADRTPAELAKTLEDTLAKVVREPKVSVVVSGFQGVYSQQIRIVGEAAKTQSVPYRQKMTVLDVMIQAGGITDFADGNGAVLVRTSKDGKKARQYNLRLGDLLKRGDITANVTMQPGDIIIIPQSWF
jgi:polysaccharide export outer membrane protein